MGKTGKWLRNFLTGKKDKEKSASNQISANYSTENVTTTPLSIPQTNSKEKKRWSFRRSSASSASPKDSIPTDPVARNIMSDIENEHKRHVMAVAAATAAATEAAVAASQAATAVIQLTAAANGKAEAIEKAAAIKIQSVFRSYLARKALCALKGLVKLQALVRGHLVRKQATATLRCMEALMTAQARARAQRLRMVEDGKGSNQRQSLHRKSIHDNQLSPQNYAHERGLLEENIKIVEVDLGNYKQSLKNKNNHPQAEQKDLKTFTNQAFSKQETYQISFSPGPSDLIEMSPRASSGHFEEYSFGTAQSSPQYYSAMSKSDPSKFQLFGFPPSEYAESSSYDYQLCPNYMANTESSRAKARSQSAPKTRPVEPFERQPSRRRVSIEGRNGVPRAVRMQRSSSHVGSATQNYQYPWSVKLDRSTVSLKDSECGSSCTVLTNTNYCRSLVAYDTNGNRY